MGNQYDALVPRTAAWQLRGRHARGARTDSMHVFSQELLGACLFVDVTGFTSLSSRLSAEDLEQVINVYFTKMIACIDALGGDVVKVSSP